jgi:hypothetical protein
MGVWHSKHGSLVGVHVGLLDKIARSETRTRVLLSQMTLTLMNIDPPGRMGAFNTNEVRHRGRVAKVSNKE